MHKPRSRVRAPAGFVVPWTLAATPFLALLAYSSGRRWSTRRRRRRLRRSTPTAAAATAQAPDRAVARRAPGRCFICRSWFRRRVIRTSPPVRLSNPFESCGSATPRLHSLPYAHSRSTSLVLREHCVGTSTSALLPGGSAVLRRDPEATELGHGSRDSTCRGCFPRTIGAAGSVQHAASSTPTAITTSHSTSPTCVPCTHRPTIWVAAGLALGRYCRSSIGASPMSGPRSGARVFRTCAPKWALGVWRIGRTLVPLTWRSGLRHRFPLEHRLGIHLLSSKTELRASILARDFPNGLGSDVRLLLGDPPGRLLEIAGSSCPPGRSQPTVLA